MKKNIVIFILLMLVIVLGLGLYQVLRTELGENKVIGIATPTPPQQLIGGDKDEHGCLIAAGYSWCEIKQKCLRTWEEPCQEITPTSAIDETNTLKQFIKQALINKHGNTANELIITVSKIEGNYAQGGASGQGGGGMWFAAKVYNQWNLVWDGNGTILCQDLEAYPQFPTDMIPECYNDKTGKSVQR